MMRYKPAKLDRRTVTKHVVQPDVVRPAYVIHPFQSQIYSGANRLLPMKPSLIFSKVVFTIALS